MEVSALGVSAPGPVYEIGGQRFKAASNGFAEAIACVHATHQRPRCLCTPEGVEMYVARLAGPHGGYIVKRMPDTGSSHACNCPSYEPPAVLSGLGQVLGRAITEDITTGETTLRLGFSLIKIPGRSQTPPTGDDKGGVATDGAKLSLRGLLHYLWDQAELTRWHTGFMGKRTWATVRRHLIWAAEQKVARGAALRNRLYVPEPFSIDRRDEINARRQAQWQIAMTEPGKPQRLMLLICEVKEIVPARFGFKAMVKHVPDQPFALDEQLYRRLGRHFKTELALWSAVQDIHLVMIATFNISPVGLPTIIELSLMPVNGQWLPIENAFEKQLIDRLVAHGRSFVKGLRYMLPRDQVLPSALLTDTGTSSRPLYIFSTAPSSNTRTHIANVEGTAADALEVPAWWWMAGDSSMPALPPVRTSQS